MGRRCDKIITINYVCTYLHSLEIISSSPIPHVETSIITSAAQHSVGVHRQTVDYGIVARQVLDELPLGALPLLDVVRRSRCESIEVGMGGERPH